MREYLLVFLVALTSTYLLTVIAREIALRTGAVAQVRDRDVHAVPIPYFGGLAMYGGLLAACLLAHRLPFLSRSGETIFDPMTAVLLAGGVVCAVGVLDDLIELDALTKLGGQVVAAGILVLMDVRFWYLPMPGGSQFALLESQATILSVLIVVATMNAVNFVDGLDGLAAGVVGIGAVAFFFFCYQVANLNNLPLAVTGAVVCVALGGACAGFIPHNFYPARLFMGDSGSMLIGLVLSAGALTLTGQFSYVDISRGDQGPSWVITLLPMLLPVSILLLPLLDLVLAVVRRTRRGQAFYHPDKQHLHHRLLEIGHSHRRAVVIMWMWAGLVAFGTVLVSLYAGPLVWSLVLVGLAVAVAVTFLLPRVPGIHGSVPHVPAE